MLCLVNACEAIFSLRFYLTLNFSVEALIYPGYLNLGQSTLLQASQFRLVYNNIPLGLRLSRGGHPGKCN